MGVEDGICGSTLAQLLRSRREVIAAMTHENPKELSKAHELINVNFEMETMVLYASDIQNILKILSLLTSLLLSLWFKPPSSSA